MKLRNLIVGLVLGVVVSLPSLAATQWSLTSASQELAPSAANKRTYTSDGNELTASAWSNTGSGGTVSAAYLDSYGSSGLGVWNGFGNEPDQSPHHSMDNNVHADSILLSFTDAIVLNSLKLGWWQTDSDITVLAYTGNGVPAISGSTYGGLTSVGGWDLVGHYSDIGWSERAVNAGNVSSSHWLISAYNPQVGGSKGWTEGNDYVKLAMVSGTKITPPLSTNAVPEPASLALLGLGLLGLVSTRRRWR